MKGNKPYGGYWTQVKLERLRRYLQAFAHDMAEQSVSTLYIDAFAATGYVQMPQRKKRVRAGFFEEPAPLCIEGSARQALNLDTPFDEYIFVDQCEECCQELKRLRAGSGPLKSRIRVVCRDANDFLTEFCRDSENWESKRAVIFLDPPGTCLTWPTIEAIAATKATDLWYLFPLGTVARMMRRRGPNPAKSDETLGRLLGTGDLPSEFYRTLKRTNFFCTEVNSVREKGCHVLIKFVVKRLKTLFPHVARNPLKLRNRKGSPMYLLCFASPSERAVNTAEAVLQRSCPTCGPTLSRLVKLTR